MNLSLLYTLLYNSIAIVVYFSLKELKDRERRGWAELGVKKTDTMAPAAAGRLRSFYYFYFLKNIKSWSFFHTPWHLFSRWNLCLMTRNKFRPGDCHLRSNSWNQTCGRRRRRRRCTWSRRKRRRHHTLALRWRGVNERWSNYKVVSRYLQ